MSSNLTPNLTMTTIPVRGKVNPKNIAETELYQENYAGERVHEGGALAGMPLDRLNRPMALNEV
jgi:hypothetical protein